MAYTPVTDNVDTVMAAHMNEAYGAVLTNRSGAQRAVGDVMIQDTGNDSSTTSTTTESDPKVIGVVGETTNDAATGLHQNRGPMASVKVTGAVSRGDYLVTSTTAVTAKSCGTVWTTGVFAIALTSAAGPGAGTVTALLLPRGLDSNMELKAADGEDITIVLDSGGTDKYAMGYDDSDDVFRICAAGSLSDTGFEFGASGMEFKGANSSIRANATSGNPDFWMMENGTEMYKVGYSVTNDRFFLWSTDIDGIGTNGDVIRVPDGQATVDGNATFDDNAFDWMCEGCGWHGPDEVNKCPACGGMVAWHDDAALMAQAARVGKVRELPAALLGKLERLGVVNTYGTANKPPKQREVFVSLTRGMWFSWAAIAQLWRRIEVLEAKHGI